MLLGCFANSPNLLTSTKYKIGNNDFKCKECEDSKFHNILYRAMYNVAVQGAEEINEIIIDTFLQKYPTQYEICKEFDFYNFIPTIKKLVSSKNIDYYYGIIRKFGMLREYKKNGYNTTEIYDELKDFESQNKKLHDLTLEDISRHFKSKQQAIDRDYIRSESVQHYKIGENLYHTKEELKKTPLIGLSYQSPFLNRICGGIEGLVLRSGESGSGKTTLSVGDICMSGVKQYYDKKAEGFVENKSYVGNVLFINTEMDIYRELDPLFASWVADVLAWENGKVVPESVGRLYSSKNKYVGDISGDGNVAKALEIFEHFGNGTSELQTSAEPYGWTLKFRDPIDSCGRDEAKQEDLMRRDAYMMIALIDNLGYMSFEYTIGGSDEVKTLTVTQEEATQALGSDIKKCAETAKSLQGAMKKFGFY